MVPLVVRSRLPCIPFPSPSGPASEQREVLPLSSPRRCTERRRGRPVAGEGPGHQQVSEKGIEEARRENGRADANGAARVSRGQSAVRQEVRRDPCRHRFDSLPPASGEFERHGALGGRPDIGHGRSHGQTRGQARSTTADVATVRAISRKLLKPLVARTPPSCLIRLLFLFLFVYCFLLWKTDDGPT